MRNTQINTPWEAECRLGSYAVIDSEGRAIVEGVKDKTLALIISALPEVVTLLDYLDVSTYYALDGAPDSEITDDEPIDIAVSGSAVKAIRALLDLLCKDF